MSKDRSEQEQPALWDEPPSSTTSKDRARRSPAGASEATTAGIPSGAPRVPTTLPSPPPASPPLDAQRLWNADQVAAYLGVPKQTLYGWRHHGKGPKGFRVGKHLRWHARTVIEWTLKLEREP